MISNVHGNCWYCKMDAAAFVVHQEGHPSDSTLSKVACVTCSIQDQSKNLVHCPGCKAEGVANMGNVKRLTEATPLLAFVGSSVDPRVEAAKNRKSCFEKTQRMAYSVLTCGGICSCCCGRLKPAYQTMV